MVYATCRTDGCLNALIPIDIQEGAATVVCGPCGQPITDLSATPPELPTEVPPWLE